MGCESDGGFLTAVDATAEFDKRTSAAKEVIKGNYLDILPLAQQLRIVMSDDKDLAASEIYEEMVKERMKENNCSRKTAQISLNFVLVG